MNDPLRKELVWQLEGGNAHAGFDEALANIPKGYYGKEIPGTPYTIWRELQHMMLSQRDILEYITNPNYKERTWPEEYWPKQKAPPTAASWNKRVREFKSDLKKLVKLVKDPKSKLLEPMPHVKNGPTLLREVLLVIDHNSYHIGQIILLRGLLDIWQD